MCCTYPAARADEDKVDASSSGASDRAPSASKQSMMECANPHNATLPHEQLHGADSRAETGQGEDLAHSAQHVGLSPAGNYGPPTGFNWEWGSVDEPFVDHPGWEENNTASRVQQFVVQCMNVAAVTRGNDIMLTMGTDFTYANAFVWCAARAWASWGALLLSGGLRLPSPSCHHAPCNPCISNLAAGACAQAHRHHWWFRHR